MHSLGTIHGMSKKLLLALSKSNADAKAVALGRKTISCLECAACLITAMRKRNAEWLVAV
jgi:ferredoxin-like protein FixX